MPLAASVAAASPMRSTSPTSCAWYALPLSSQAVCTTEVATAPESVRRHRHEEERQADAHEDERRRDLPVGRIGVEEGAREGHAAEPHQAEEDEAPRIGLTH